MSRRTFPDAWDDDWETTADKLVDDDFTPREAAPMTKAERLAKHAEANKKLWDSAESPQEFHFLSANTAAPPATTAAFKPAVKVLSRKPIPQMVMKKDPVTGMQQMALQDDDQDEEETKNQETPEERKVRQQKELEEKQRRYDEARAKIFGETKSNPPSGRSTPGNVTPPQPSDGRQSHRGKARGRGGGGGGGHRGDNHSRNDSQGKRATGQSNGRELFDPGYSTKPGFALQKRSEAGSPQPRRSATPRDEDQVIRAPRGPDGSGRGGFGFAQHNTNDG